MTRSRSTAPAWDDDNRDSFTCGMFSEMCDEAKIALGRQDISLGTGRQQLIVGLPLPSLALRYLFQSTVFPLGRVVQVTGEEGSAKSAFAAEMLRWHAQFGGGGVWIDNELKDSPDLRNSILMWNPLWIARTEAMSTFALEEWQAALSAFVAIAKKQQDDPRGPGFSIPILFVVDSLLGTATKSEIDNIQASGFAERGWAIAAQLITKYMRSVPQLIQVYPFTILGTNHLKPAVDFMGRPTATVPGGKSVKFHETYEIEMHKDRNCDIDLLEYGGLRVKLIMRKNSLGPSRKQICAELLWWTEIEQDGVARQKSAWDWDASSIELILGYQTSQNKKSIWRAISEFLDLTLAERQGRKVWSNVLGIPKAEPVHFRQAGAILESRPDLLARLYPLLGIMERRPFVRGQDLRALRASEAAAGDAEAASLYRRVEDLPVPELRPVPTPEITPPEEEEVVV